MSLYQILAIVKHYLNNLSAEFSLDLEFPLEWVWKLGDESMEFQFSSYLERKTTKHRLKCVGYTEMEWRFSG